MLAGPCSGVSVFPVGTPVPLAWCNGISEEQAEDAVRVYAMRRYASNLSI